MDAIFGGSENFSYSFWNLLFIITFKEEKDFLGHKDYLVIYDERNLKECEIYYLSEIKSGILNKNYLILQ